MRLPSLIESLAQHAAVTAAAKAYLAARLAQRKGCTYSQNLPWHDQEECEDCRALDNAVFDAERLLEAFVSAADC